MELALNILWLAVATTSLAWWAVAARSLRSHRRALLREFGAVTLSLAFLFPVISLTDDLHEQAMSCEDPAPSKSIIQPSGHDRGLSTYLQVSPPLALAGIASVVVPFARLLWLIEPACSSSLRSLSASSAPNRAPPASH